MQTNVTLRAKLNNNNIVIEQTSSVVTEGSNIIEVLVYPKSGYKLEPEDLSLGYLPITISSITFEKNKDTVIAVVAVNFSAIAGDNAIVIDLPISAIIKPSHHNASIVESVIKDEGIVSSTSSTFPTKTNKNSTTYSVKNALGKRMLVFTRVFVITNNYAFAGEPSYTIGTNPERFTVETKSTSDIVEFKVYYTSPSSFDDSIDTEVINFTANSKIVDSAAIATTGDGYGNEGTTTTVSSGGHGGGGTASTTDATNFKIYSFDAGRKISAQGGVRKLKVKGVPGTPFKLLLQDSNLKTYNFVSGVYEVGGGMLQAVVPPARQGFGYGEYIAMVNVPRSVGAVSYSDRLIKDTDIDHSTITSIASANLETVGSVDILTESVASQPAKVTISLDTTGSFTTAFEDVVFGPGEFASAVSGSLLSFKVNAPPGSSIAIARQPLEATPGAEFAAWSSGDKTTLLTAGSSGAEIKNDWSNTRVVAGKTESSTITVKINLTASANGTSIKGTMSIGTVTFGQGDNTYNLKLLNFLTLTSL